MPPSQYQRILLTGVPVWKDAEGKVYYYESQTPPTAETRICIGSEATGFSSDWQSKLEQHLRAYREASVSRARAAKK